MEFWGVELKGGKPVKIEPGMNKMVHLSLATLPDLKKGSETVMLYAKVGNQKLVIGILSAEKYPQLELDLVFEKEFELSHNWKNGSVHLTGYKSLIPDDEEVYSDSSDEEEAVPVEEKPSGVAAAPASTKAKPAAPAAKKDIKPKEESEEDDDSDSDESDEDDDVDAVMAMMVAGAAEDDDSDDDESDEEETPVNSTGGKKRPAAAAAPKTPEAKNVKVITPQKSEGKKNSVGGHIATPHPAKNAKSPKSGGQVSCGPCNKTFNSQSALDSHSKAKHASK